MYDFTTLVTSAFGDNLINCEDKYCLFSGDALKDDFIDVSDLRQIDNDVTNFVEGYVQSDLTGDNFVDVSDLVFVTNNVDDFIGVINP